MLEAGRERFASKDERQGERELRRKVAELERVATPDGFRPLVEASLGIFEPKMSPDGSKIAYQDGDSISTRNRSDESNEELLAVEGAEEADGDDNSECLSVLSSEVCFSDEI